MAFRDHFKNMTDGKRTVLNLFLVLSGVKAVLDIQRQMLHRLNFPTTGNEITRLVKKCNTIIVPPGESDLVKLLYLHPFRFRAP